MTDLRIATSEGADAILEEAAVEAFASTLRGPLLRPGEDGYDRARVVVDEALSRGRRGSSGGVVPPASESTQAAAPAR